MARYIDADAFIGKLKTSKDFQEKYATFREVKMTTFFIESVENEPTADVAEVKHGEWDTTDTPLGRCCVCSVCGSCPTVEYNYCPYCGAKMDGGKI